LKPVLPDADPGKVVAHRWRKRFCTRGDTGTAVDPVKMAAALTDAQRRCLRICEVDGLAKFTGEFEWYTPPKYIALARTVLGDIDLDPASSEPAQKTVKARRYYTLENDGLKQEWHGRIWLNPPYHRALLPTFVDKLLGEIEAGRVIAAIMLTNNGTDAEWFTKAQAACDAICFTHGRIQFDGHGPVGPPPQGQAFFYFGDDVTTFRTVFSEIGFGVAPLWPLASSVVRSNGAGKRTDE
jgi:phage N-6-adenine-methyltransferase